MVLPKMHSSAVSMQLWATVTPAAVSENLLAVSGDDGLDGSSSTEETRGGSDEGVSLDGYFANSIILVMKEFVVLYGVSRFSTSSLQSTGSRPC